MKVMLRNCHIIDLRQVQYAEIKREPFRGVGKEEVTIFYSIRLVFINGKEEEVCYGGDEAQATNDFKLIVEVLNKGEKND
jgi:hypothetical protein